MLRSVVWQKLTDHHGKTFISETLDNFYQTTRRSVTEDIFIHDAVRTWKFTMFQVIPSRKEGGIMISRQFGDF